MNKKYVYLIVAGIAIVVLSVFLAKDKIRTGNINDMYPSPSFEPSPSSITESTLSATPIKTSKPTPTLIYQEIRDYEGTAYRLDNDGNRRLVLNEDCSAIVPSQVAYKNGVEIMLDNSYSTQSRILKIGDYQFSLDAGAWFLTTLSSPKIPINLTMFCGSMELGQIELY